MDQRNRKWCFHVTSTRCSRLQQLLFFSSLISPPPQGKELLTQKIPVWQQMCAEPNKLPDRAMFLAQQMSGAAGTLPPGAHHPGTSEQVSGAKPLPGPPEQAGFRAGGGQQVSSSTLSRKIF